MLEDSDVEGDTVGEQLVSSKKNNKKKAKRGLLTDLKFSDINIIDMDITSIVLIVLHASKSRIKKANPT